MPSGASTGIYEALEMRDGGKDYHKKGKTFKKILPMLGKIYESLNLAFSRYRPVVLVNNRD